MEEETGRVGSLGVVELERSGQTEESFGLGVKCSVVSIILSEQLKLWLEWQRKQAG